MFDTGTTRARAEARVGQQLLQWRLEHCTDVDVLGASYLGTAPDGASAELFVVNEDVADDEQVRLELSRGVTRLPRFEHARAVGCIEGPTSSEGLWFLRSKLVRGETWAELLTRRPHSVPPAEVLRVCADILDVLDAAHAHQVVHGAIEPRFITITESGAACLRGFGMAEARRRAATLLGLRLVPGSVGFVAPNQIVGEPADAASDVWSVAALALHVMTGQFSYPGANEAEREHAATLGRVRHLAQIEPEAPAPLVDLLDSALDNPVDAHLLAVRFRDAADAQEVRTLRHLRDETPHRKNASARPAAAGSPGIATSVPPAPQYQGPRPRGGYSQMSPAVQARTVPQFDQVDGRTQEVREGAAGHTPVTGSRPPRR